MEASLPANRAAGLLARPQELSLLAVGAPNSRGRFRQRCNRVIPRWFRRRERARWRRTISVGVASVVLLGFCLPASASAQLSGRMWDMCGQATDPNVVIGACSQLVESGLLMGDDMAKVLARRGVAYAQAGRNGEAFADLDRAVTLQPDVAIYRRDRGDARRKLGWSRSLGWGTNPSAQTDLNEKAIGDYDAAWRLDPKDVLILTHRAEAFMALGRFERALDDLDQAIALDTKLVAAWEGRGVARFNLGKLTEAITDFDVAVALDPAAVVVRLHRGLAYANMGDYDRSIADFDAAIGHDPANANAFNFRGVSNLRRGRLDLAINDFDRALLLDPNYAGAYFNRGRAYYDKGDKDRALADFVQARSLDKRFPEPPADTSENYEADIPNRFGPRRPFSSP